MYYSNIFFKIYIQKKFYTNYYRVAHEPNFIVWFFSKLLYTPAESMNNMPRLLKKKMALVRFLMF